MHAYFPKIKYVPLTYTYQEFLKLEALEEEFYSGESTNLNSLMQELDHLADAHSVYLLEKSIAVEGDINYPLLIANARTRFPFNLSLKIDFANYHFMPLESKRDISDFKELFKIELSCLFNYQEYKHIISDAEYKSLLDLCMEYALAINDDSYKERLLRIAYGLEEDFFFEMAVKAKEADDLIYRDIDFAESQDNAWLIDKIEMLNADYDIAICPINQIFYTLLNKDITELEETEISIAANLENKQEILEDLLWYLHQGLHRFNNADEDFNFLYTSLYIAAHYNIKEFACIYFKIVLNLEAIILEEYFGDVGYQLLLAPMLYLIPHDLEGLEKVLKEDYNEDVWYSKTIYLNMLLTIIVKDSERSREEKALLNKMLKYIEKTDKTMLGWLVYALMDFRLEEYYPQIQKLYKENKIDLNIHETFEENISGSSSIIVTNDYNTEVDLHSTFQYYRAIVQGLNQSLYTLPFDQIIDQLIIRNGIPVTEMVDDYHGILEEDEQDFPPPAKVINLKKKIGRNDACPCGSGKKYKKCCLIMS